MKTCFPARKKNGENYATLDEMMDLIGQEPHGSWLAGTNNMWHGGIHISEKSAPGSVLKPDMAETPVPLQCMAEGEVVAWRLNKDYQKSTCLGQPVQYTTTFVLVKSNCLPDKDKAQTQLDFYSLYMGLAPLSAFEKHKCMVAKKTVSKRKAGRYESSQNPGAPAHAPQAIGELVQGTRVLILKEATFLNKPVPAPAHSGATELQPFGLAQAFDKDGKLKDEQFWVTLLPEYMAAEGEQYAHLPLWMQKAVEQGTFDAVTKPATALKISAGDAIGFLGEDIAPAGMAKTSSSTYAHIEVLCADSRMPAFLDNPGQVTSGRKYIRVHPTAKLCTLSGDTFTRTTTPVKKDMHIILPVDKCNPKESGGRTYYQAGQSYWLSQDDVDLIDQYNLKELGFIALAEENTPDMSASLQEGWMKSGYRWLAEQLRPERGIQEQQMSTFYKGMIDKMDTDKDGQLSERELFAALHHPEMGVRDIVSRMIVKHQSEWFGGSSHQKWTAFFQDYDVLRIGFAKKWLDDMEWMSQVEPFTSGKAVWHMHPVMFCSAIKSASEYEITVELIEKLLKHKNPWFTGRSGGKVFAAHFKNTYPDVYECDKQNFVNILNEQLISYDITGAYHKAHFLSQCLHESAHLDTTIEFGTGHNYDPGQHKDAIKNGNTVIGDGPKYKGRGLIQLTWKKNYQHFSEYSGVDCVNNSDLIASVMSNAIKASCWFWRNNGGVHKKYNAKGDINILIDNEKNNVELVTLAVNGGQNGLLERKIYFDLIKKEWGLE